MTTQIPDPRAARRSAPRFPAAAFAALLLAGSLVPGLLAAASAATDTGDSGPAPKDEVVQMSMFEVTTTQGHGYVATNSATALKTNESLMDIPQTVQVLSRDLLNDIGRDLTAQNLEFFGLGLGKVGESTSVRGLGTSYAWVDDMPENQPFEDNAPFDSIEVIKGPAQVLYVNSTLSGIVLKATKKPLPFPQLIGTAQVNDWGQYRFTADYSTPIGTVGGAKLGNRVVLVQQGGNNWQLNVKDDRTVIFDSFQILYRNTTVRLDYDYQHLLTIPAGEDFFGPDGKLYTGAGRKWTGYFKNSMSPDESKRFSAHFLQRISDNWESKFQASVWSLVVNTQSTYGNLKVTWPTTETVQPSYGVSYYQYWVLTQDFHGNYKVARFANEDAFGFAYSDFTTKSYSIGYAPGATTLPLNNLAAVEAFTLPPNSYYQANLPANEGSYAKTVWGEIYWSHTLDIVPNWVSVVGGWTWDYSSANTVPNISTLPFQATIVPAEQFLHRIGIVVKPVKGISLYALQATSFTPPTGSSLLENLQLPPPQQGKDNEVGLKMNFFGGKISGDFAWFHMTLTNALSVGGLFPNGSGYFVPTGFAREEGVDGDVAFALVPGWQLITNFYAGHDRDQNDAPVSSTFDNQLSFFTRYQFQKPSPLSGLAFGGGLARLGGRWASASGLTAPGVTLKSPFRVQVGTLVDGFVAYQFNRHLGVKVACNNILDQAYPEGVINPLTVNAVPPRTWYFSGAYQY